MRVDYTQVEDGNQLIPAGQYHVIVSDVVEQINQNSGNTAWLIKSEVLNGSYKGAKIDDFNTFTDSLASANKGMFKAFGFDVDNKVLNIEPSDLIGKQVLVNVIQDEYNGKKRNKVERFGGYEMLLGETLDVTKTGKVENDDIPF